MFKSAIVGARTALLVFLLASVPARAEPLSPLGDFGSGDSGQQPDDNAIIPGAIQGAGVNYDLWLPLRTDLFRWDNFAPPSLQSGLIPAFAQGLSFARFNRGDNEGFYRPADLMTRTDVLNFGSHGFDWQSEARADDFSDIYKDASSGRASPGGAAAGDESSGDLRSFVLAPGQIDAAYLEVLAAEQADSKIFYNAVDVLKQIHTDLAEVRNSVFEDRLVSLPSGATYGSLYSSGDSGYDQGEGSARRTANNPGRSELDEEIEHQLELAVSMIREYYWIVLAFALVALVLQAALRRQ